MDCTLKAKIMFPKERCKSKFWGKLSTSLCTNDQKPNKYTNPGQVSHKSNKQGAAFKTALHCTLSAADPTGTLIKITAGGMLTSLHQAQFLETVVINGHMNTHIFLYIPQTILNVYCYTYPFLLDITKTYRKDVFSF